MGYVANKNDDAQLNFRLYKEIEAKVLAHLHEMKFMQRILLNAAMIMFVEAEGDARWTAIRRMVEFQKKAGSEEDAAGIVDKADAKSPALERPKTRQSRRKDAG